MKKVKKQGRMPKLSREDFNKLRTAPNMVMAKFHYKDGLIDQIKIGQEDNPMYLYIDTKFEKQWNAQPWCEVVKVPEKLFVSYKPRSRERSLRWDTDIEIEVGDEILVDYTVVTNALNHADYDRGGAYLVDDELYIIFRYDMIKVKMDGNIPIPINGYVLATAVDIEYDGSLIIPSTVNQKSERVFEVTHIGSKLKGYPSEPSAYDTDDVQVGSRVLIRGRLAYQLERQVHRKLDKEYYAFQRRHVSGVYYESQE